MKICGISDMHGNYNFQIDKCNVLCIAGDIVPLKIQMDTYLSFEWIKEKFIPWCESQPVDKVIVVAGNHDFFARGKYNKVKEVFKGTKIVYLCDEEYMYDDVKFYGTPWCHIFGNWPFMVSEESLQEKFAKMPNDVDVLITHDSPYGVSDILLQSIAYASKGNIGNKPLADAVSDKQPKIMLHGHLHSTNHEMELLKETKVYCVSVLDESYRLKYKPLYLEI